MNVLNFMNYLLRFSMLGFLVLVIVLSDPTLFPTMRLMAAILCGIVLLVGIGFVLRLGGRGLDWGERLGNAYVGALMGMPVGLLLGGFFALGGPYILRAVGGAS